MQLGGPRGLLLECHAFFPECPKQILEVSPRNFGRSSWKLASERLRIEFGAPNHAGETSRRPFSIRNFSINRTQGLTINFISFVVVLCVYNIVLIDEVHN